MIEFCKGEGERAVALGFLGLPDINGPAYGLELNG
jgi:hypothetical protein